MCRKDRKQRLIQVIEKERTVFVLVVVVYVITDSMHRNHDMSLVFMLCPPVGVVV